ncbi:MAG: pilus (MSHA type) biogenesis protein MshL [Magnetococcus sp. YQC-3]
MHVNGYEKFRRDACVLLCAVTLFVTGCQTSPLRGRPVASELRDAVMGEERGSMPADAVQPFAGRMSRRLSLPRPEGGYREERPVQVRPGGRRMTVQVLQTPIRAFFESLVSQEPGISMVVHPDVEGDISVELKGVTVDEAVEIVCEMHRLDCQPLAGRTQDGGVRGYKIYPWQLTTRTYPVDFLSVVRDGYSLTTVSSGNRQEVTTARNEKEQGKTVTVTQSVPGSGMRTEYKSDFWKDLESTITSILQLGLAVSKVTEETNEQGGTKKTVIRERRDAQKFVETSRKKTQVQMNKTVGTVATVTEQPQKEPPGAVSPPLEESASGLLPPEKGVVINRQAGLITVRAYPREHQEIASFLEQLRQRSQRQVILEAKVLEVGLNDDAQFGIDWLAVNRGIGGLVSPPSATGAGSVLASRGAVLSRALGVDQPFNAMVRTSDFVGVMHLLQQQGTVQVLSSPRVATVNNQKAVIKVGSDEFFATGIHPGQVYGSGINQVINPPTLAMESMFTGISLDVTPQVGEGDMITLHIHPLVTEVQDKVKSFVVDDKPQSLPMAFTQTRETDSIIRVRNGDVAVIGGLMKNRSREREERLPWLGELPLLGNLFGHLDKRWEKSELVILLRPMVVESRQEWDGHVVRAAARMEGIARMPP